MNRFLKLKNYQIVFLLFSPVIFFYLIYYISYFFILHKYPDVLLGEDRIRTILFLGDIRSLYEPITVAFLVLWFYNISDFLYKYLDENLQVDFNIRFFKINSFYLVIAYSLTRIISFIISIRTYTSFSVESNLIDQFNGVYAILMIPIALYGFFSSIYIINFSARIYRTFILKSKPRFGFYFSDFLMLLLLPIGIWGFQNRINDLCKIQENETP